MGYYSDKVPRGSKNVLNVYTGGWYETGVILTLVTDSSYHLLSYGSG